jgi:hypothetical protein
VAAPVDVAGAVERAAGERPRAVSLLKGAGNNVVAKVEMRAGPLAAKVYFRHPGDPRDRLGTEHGFLSFLWREGVRSVPRPVLAHRGENLGLYEFVEGVKPAAADLGWDEASQLIDFLGALHDRRARPGADALGNASDHALSLAAYAASVTARYERLRRAVEAGPDAEVRGFVAGPLAGGLERVKRFAEDRCARHALRGDRELAPDLRTLSPADHGFHNTLRRDGKLVFLDFEYAGWDDPAHVIANACLQPQVPMPEALRSRFVEAAAGRLGGGAELPRRLRAVYPLLALKWSLIMLNEFLPVDRERRSFAGEDVERRKAEQLEKAGRQLAAAELSTSDGFFLEKIAEA